MADLYLKFDSSGQNMTTGTIPVTSLKLYNASIPNPFDFNASSFNKIAFPTILENSFGDDLVVTGNNNYLFDFDGIIRVEVVLSANPSGLVGNGYVKVVMNNPLAIGYGILSPMNPSYCFSRVIPVAIGDTLYIEWEQQGLGQVQNWLSNTSSISFQRLV